MKNHFAILTTLILRSNPAARCIATFFDNIDTFTALPGGNRNPDQSFMQRRRFWRIGLCGLAVILMASACRSGSDSITTPENFETPEYFRSGGGLSLIKASAAYTEGYTGTGVTVAVIGGRGTSNDPEEWDPEPQHYIINDSGGIEDGPFVGAGLLSMIAAPKNDKYIHGVAYNSKIIAIDSTSGLSPAVRLAAGLTASHPQVSADVILANSNYLTNLTSGGENVASLQEAAQRDKLLVVPATPETSAPELGDVVKSPEMNGQMIVVGPIDARWLYLQDAAPAGALRDHFVVAPGTAYTGTTSHKWVYQCRYELFLGYICEHVWVPYKTKLTGPDVAAAFVTGAAAILKQAFPHLSADQIAQILFQTATDLGVEGVDDTYGHGLINLAAALQPIGSLAVPTGSTVSGTTADLSVTSLALGPAFGDALANNPLLEQAVALDAFGRPFRAGLAGRVSGRIPGMNLQPLMARPALRGLALPAAKGVSLNLAVPADDTQNAVIGNDTDAASFAAAHELNDAENKPPLSLSTDLPLGGKLNLSIGMSPHGYFQLAQGADRHNHAASYFHDTASVRMPHLSLLGSARGAVYAQGLGRDTEVSLSWFASEQNGPDEGGQVVQSLLRHRIGDRGTLAVGYGVLQEEDAFLSSRSEGAFGGIDETRSYFTSILGAVDLGNRLALVGSYSTARVHLETAGNGLLGDWSPIDADSASLGFTGHGLSVSGDRAGILLSQPFRVNRAEATLTVPVGRDVQGNLIRKGDRVDMTPSGRQVDLQLFYQRPIMNGADVATYMFLRREPGHDADAKPEIGVALKASVRF